MTVSRSKALRLALWALLCAVMATPFGQGAHATDLPFKIGGPFSLTDHHGRPVTEASFPGQHLLVYFGYTYCPDICPTDLARLAAALDLLQPEALSNVQPLFVTVDPERDTAEVMAGYVSAFHPAILGLTGTEAQVAAAAKAFRVHRMKVPMPDAGPEEYLINHTPNAYLIDPQGNFQTLFPHDSKIEFISKILTRYLSHRNQPIQSSFD